SAALTDSASVTLSLVIDASSLIRSYTDRFTVPQPVRGLVPDVAQPVAAVQRITHGGAVQGADLTRVAQAYARVEGPQHAQWWMR
ncbi:hypothetical protein ACH4NU_38310, partial [Streptomyces sp. NPDC017259]|uniref:hypothetical protein n=1 Tax=Streptomyces sp. NPDC017259 TaxID=3364991 RepID=UPI0037A31C5F